MQGKFLMSSRQANLPVYAASYALQANLYIYFTDCYKEILVLKPSQYDGCYHVTMVLVLQMVILAKNYDVTMVLVQ